MSYAIIKLGGKQYTVREGERLLVDRLTGHAEGKTFTPDVLLVGGDGATRLAPKDVTVTVKVLGEQLGEKIRIGKYRPKTGYRKHGGFRAKLSSIEIESIGTGRARPAAKKEPAKAEKAAAASERPKGLPSGYDELTVAQIKEQAGTWRRPQLEAALAYERSKAARKGALAALESALAEKEEGH